MDWELFNIVGTIAFALSGAIMASEEDYDLIGFYALGFVTAFGGGALRNMLIGVPAEKFWNQQELFIVALIFITIVYVVPFNRLTQWKHWFYVYGLLDAIGLAAFAIQGALFAQSMNLPSSAIIVSALLTGVGGGIIRDLLAKRQPFVFKYELYAFWTILTGIAISSEIISNNISLYILFVLIIVLRMLSLFYNWNIPRPKRRKNIKIKESTL